MSVHCVNFDNHNKNHIIQAGASMTSSYCFIYSETSKFRVTDEEVFDALDAYDSSFMEHSQTFPTAGLLPVGSARAVPAIPVPLPGDADVCLFHRLQDPLPR